MDLEDVIFPSIEEELKDFLTKPERLPIHQYERNQQFWPREPNVGELLYFDTLPASTTLKMKRDSDSGAIVDIIEVPVQEAGADAKNSMSLGRAPAAPDEAVRGNAMFIPFWPGSFPDPTSNLPTHTSVLDTELLTVPPGFTHGITFDTDGRTIVSDKDAKVSQFKLNTSNVVNLLELVKQEQDLLGNWEHETKKEEEVAQQKDHQEDIPEEKEVLPNEVPLLNISTAPPSSGELHGTEWAILLDTSQPVPDFNSQIPDMACTFPFELDPFQQLAILHLERHHHVFVAAHTSAGKTVVAEYAIALSRRHMTRTIYTSPIKALSNQKYRDFKRQFKDVGLITGDFQINTTAACLIMTTEILKSMLYCGSDITRDLEYCIFDEVHYINDKERGHVWEQVLILLPAHVCVVLLSATVPNTVQFADWLGRTHKRKVYVVTTPRRPVPLKHYLYTGTGGHSRDHRFLVLDRNTWNSEGYTQAITSVKSQDKSKTPIKDKHGRERQHYQRPGPSGTPTGYVHPKHDLYIWRGLVDHLQRLDLLPVVAFLFSRARCDATAEGLRGLDLTTAKEKGRINLFYEKCIKSLKEPDRNIPQVVVMREILVRGIGVHHSGILPIVKEIVEMLFQHGLIKLLFATETFAMGVNMPARTVVFDSLSKHDGQEKRLLLPAEYIQMAGRAGRRGLDSEGTVVVLCKGQVPPDRDLRQVMQGRPSQLQSRFRLTYGMVLNLLRVESITVEGMMLRSFGEADHQKSMESLREELEKVQEKIEQLQSQELGSYLMPLGKYFECAQAFLKKHTQIMERLALHPKITKVLSPGRVVLLTRAPRINRLALVLTAAHARSSKFRLLVLEDEALETKEEQEDTWCKMVGLASEQVFCPTGAPNHAIIEVIASDIMQITSATIKVDSELVIKDWEKRQLERFRDDPPGQSCSKAIQELHRLLLACATNEQQDAERPKYLHFIDDLRVNDGDIYEDLNHLYRLKDRIVDYLTATQAPSFCNQFKAVYERKSLEEKRKDLEFRLSNASMYLYADYEKRIELLRDMGYIDSQNRVQLKGRVACEMGMNELLITELVLKNVLKGLRPPEVAALLSALVYKVKSRFGSQMSDEWSPLLKQGIEKLKQIHQDIGDMERKLLISTDEFQDDLNFDLVKVIYDWANNKCLADIMQETDVQEGLIVRAVQQLHETVRDVRDAARIIGDPELQSRMDEVSAAIKRDIAFAVSLYTQGDQAFLST